jgi:acyl dehydratase
LLVADLSRTHLVQYAGASGDYNPLHTDERYATEVAGYPSVFAHGMFTMGLMGTMLARLFGDGALRSFGGRFSAQVWPGDALNGTVSVTGHKQGEESRLLELALAVINQHGEVVFTGTAVALASRRAQFDH